MAFMADEVFTDPDEPSDQWVDVRMTDPELEEWDIDVIVANGQVQYVDLRIRPALLGEFVDCLIDDVGKQRAKRVLTDLADNQDVDLDLETTEE
jgi:hypothetical protein